MNSNNSNHKDGSYHIYAEPKKKPKPVPKPDVKPKEKKKEVKK
jgi:hypothetical protein